MKLYLDTANLAAIREAVTCYPIVGVTTNPTLLAREGGNPIETLQSIRRIIGEERQLHVQLTETEPNKMTEEAQAIVGLLGRSTYIKIPVGEIGLQVTSTLADLGIGVTETAIFTAGQALLAARAGASYVAPYVNRLDNILADGVGVVSDIRGFSPSTASPPRCLPPASNRPSRSSASRWRAVTRQPCRPMSSALPCFTR